MNRKFSGMTGSQIGILAGLALLVFCLFGITGYLIFTGGLGLPGSRQAPSSPEPIATLIVPPTSTPTIVPSAIPYEQLIPEGWIQHTTSLMEIWLPSDYRKTTIKDLSILNKQLTVELTLSRTPTDTSLYNLYVIIAHEPLQGDSLTSHLEYSPTDLPATPTTLRVVEQRNVHINATPAVRLVFEGKSSDNIDANSLVYVFLDGNTVWYVEYWTQINEFYNHLEIFEKSILTFRLVK
jgi:hypothetical protein